jgi:hypothetical protein
MVTEKRAIAAVMDFDEAAIQERIHLLKRLRNMLEIQRDKFRSYLNVLDKQEISIKSGDSKALEAQAAMEQQLVREIMSVQKVIEPLDSMYSRMYPEKQSEIINLQSSLRHLQDQVLRRNQENRELLSRQRDELKKQIDALRLPRANRSVYGRQSAASMVDISA